MRQDMISRLDRWIEWKRRAHERRMEFLTKYWEIQRAQNKAMAEGQAGIALRAQMSISPSGLDSLLGGILE